MLAQRIDGIDEDERPFREPPVHELVRGLEFREVEPERDFQEVPLHLAAADRLRLLVIALLPFHQLPLQLVEGVARDL